MTPFHHVRNIGVLAIAALVIAAVALSGCGTSRSEKPIQTFCGAASKPAIEDCIATFREKTGIEVEAQFGGSGEVLSKLKMAKRGDIYIPGSPDFMIKAERDEMIDPGSVRIVVYLVPAILVQKGNPKGIKSLEDLARPAVTVGIGNPEAVCVGLYAVEILAKANLLDKVAENIVVHAESCEKTAALIVLKKVDAILGWSVFSEWNTESTEAVLLDPAQIPRLAYVPAGVCKTSKDPERASKFVEFLTSPEGQRIFAKWGYLATEAEARKFAPNASVGGEYCLPASYRPPVRR